jgi:hypothetical protein
VTKLFAFVFIFVLPKSTCSSPIFLKINCNEIMALFISYDSFIHIGLYIDQRNHPFGIKSGKIT